MSPGGLRTQNRGRRGQGLGQERRRRCPERVLQKYRCGLGKVADYTTVPVGPQKSIGSQLTMIITVFGIVDIRSFVRVFLVLFTDIGKKCVRTSPVPVQVGKGPTLLCLFSHRVRSGSGVAPHPLHPEPPGVEEGLTVNCWSRG